MMVFIYIIVIILASIILVKSTHWVIKSLNYIAQYCRIPEFVVAFILAGLATSFPELFVGIASAINKTPLLSLSNVLGSNIVDITLILGLTIILTKGLESKSKIINRNILFTAILLVYPLLLASDRLISRVDGIGLLVLFILYNFILFYQSRSFTKTLKGAQRRDLFKNFLLFVAGLAVLMVSADILVRVCSLLAIELNISLFLIGLFIVAIGTSLPELIFGIRAATEKHEEMILGNILGSLVSNSTAILGITAIICPIMINDFSLLISSSVFLLIAYSLFAIFAQSKGKISWREGMVLTLFYICFIIIQFLVK